MFRKLCGEDSLENVIIVTNMWGLVDPRVGEARERELIVDERLFQPVLAKGARIVRHSNTKESAHNILRKVIQNTPMPLQIQKELVEEQKDISETEAAVELDRELAAQAQKHRQELKDIKKEMTEAIALKDEETKKDLETVRLKLVEDMKRIEDDRERLSSEYAAEKQRADEWIASMMKSIEESEKHRIEGDKRLAKLQEEYKEAAAHSAVERRELLEQIKALDERLEPGFFESLGNAVGALMSLRF